MLLFREGGCPVRDHNCVVFKHHRVARGRFAADIGLGARDEQVADAAFVERSFR